MASLLTQIKVRKDTYANIQNLVLAQGEPGFAYDTGDYAVGDGSSKFKDICLKLKDGVINNGTSTDNAIARFDGTTGRVIQNSSVTIDDSGNMVLPQEASLKLNTYGTRFLTLTGNSITADMSAVSGGWAGAFATVKAPDGNITTMLGWYGGASLTHIFMGGTYSDPAMKMTAAGLFTFKNPVTLNAAQGTAPLVVASTTKVTNLNADLLDGQDGSYYLDYNNLTNKPSIPDVSDFVTKSTAQTITGNKTFTGNVITSNNKFEIKANSNTDDSWIKLTNATDAGYYAFGIRRPYDTYGLQLKIHPASGSDTYYDIWHAGNDGAGSGLDADKLDGQEGSYYLNYDNLTNTPTIPNPEDYYWADVKVSKTASASTTPTFSTIAISNANAANHIIFQRDGWNYVSANAGTSAAIAFIAGNTAATPSGANSSLTIKNAELLPGLRDNEVSLGGKHNNTTYHFKDLYIKGTIYNGEYSYTLPAASGTLALTNDLPNMDLYMPKSGGQFTGPISFKDGNALPNKTLQYIVGIDAFASGGQAGWQSKTDFLNGYVTGSGLTADTIILGGGSSSIKTSSKKISTSVGTDDTTVPTSKAVKSFVEGKGYITSDTKVTNTLNTTTKYYITGTISATTNTDTQIFDTGVYVSAASGALHANTVNINEQATMKYDATNQCIRFVIN